MSSKECVGLCPDTLLTQNRPQTNGMKYRYSTALVLVYEFVTRCGGTSSERAPGRLRAHGTKNRTKKTPADRGLPSMHQHRSGDAGRLLRENQPDFFGVVDVHGDLPAVREPAEQQLVG
jgi:hypothetical protein